MKYYERIIIGAGIYGLYSALVCGKNNESVLVLEREKKAFTRASYANQARVHMGYHYPRSMSTALKSALYFERFRSEYRECIYEGFDQIYATSEKLSYTNAIQFKKFCNAAQIECLEINPHKYFKDNKCDGAFLVKEYTYDAKSLRDYYLTQLEKMSNVTIKYAVRIESINIEGDYYRLKTNLEDYETGFLLNATYASINQVIQKVFDLPQPFTIKYELCEVILCKTNETLRNAGITVMDGPFFSIMPFGKTGMHSLTSVSFTPHCTSYDVIPYFPCMDRCDKKYCNKMQLGNCNECKMQPNTSFPYMSGLAKKYLLDDYEFEYEKSLFSIKPILKSTEVDDARPTLIKVHAVNPTFVSVLSGKVNTIFDLDEVIKNEKLFIKRK